MKKIKFLLVSFVVLLVLIFFIVVKCDIIEDSKKLIEIFVENFVLVKVKEAWNNNIKDKISSVKNYIMILIMLKDSVNDVLLKELILLFNVDEVRKRLVKE